MYLSRVKRKYGRGCPIRQHHYLIDLIHLDKLLASESSTTEMLEYAMKEKLTAHILEQYYVENNEQEAVHRATILFIQNKELIVSQNSVLLYPQYIPDKFLEALFEKKGGIGELLNEMSMVTCRHIIKNGIIDYKEAINVLGDKISLLFPDINGKVPFKYYFLEFDKFSSKGMEIIEYFNPIIFRNLKDN